MEASNGEVSQGLEDGNHYILEGVILDKGWGTMSSRVHSTFEDSIDEEEDKLAARMKNME